MQKDNPLLFVILLAVGLFMASGKKLPVKLPIPLGKPSPSKVDIVYPEPSPELKAKVAPVTERLSGGDKEDAAHLAALYAALADAIRRETEQIKTTSQLRMANKKAGAILFARRSIAGKYPGLRETLDGIVSDALGRENKQLDDATRKMAADVFSALAWACHQAAK